MKKNLKNKPNKLAKRSSSGYESYSQRRDAPGVKAKIKDIDLNLKKAEVQVCVSRIVQTGGPTIFISTDGTGTLSLKGFIGPGERAYPEIEEGDCIRAVIEVGEFQGEIEGNITKVFKLTKTQKEEFLKELEKIELKRAEVEVPEFLVKDKILDKLKERFIDAAKQIKLAVIQGRPIIVRHHNDADGYSSGFALERAILPLVVSEHGNEKSAWEFFSRAPCAAPFYELDDSIRDTANSLRNVAKFSNKMPLIIIADNGSSPEDLMAIKQGKIHGADFIVIDHHGFDKDVISSEVKVHINPFLVDEDGSAFSAGMLCAEIARFINNDVKNIKQIPAMAGFADRIELKNPEVMDKYLKIAEKEGYTRELLADISLVTDYVSRKVRFMEVREYIEVLFGEPRDKQKELVCLMAPHIRNLDSKGLAIGKSNVQIEEVGKVSIQRINIDDVFPGFGFFPNAGRVVGLLHDNLQIEKSIASLVTIGIMKTAITIRATNEANFSVHELIEFLNRKLPNAFVSGGGHKNAGSISFLPNKQKEVLDLFHEFVKSR
jgi:archaea-specific RecJ-like exonuclease